MENLYHEKISETVYWVGVKDWNRKLFDALIPLPQGTSYNAYLVKGKSKIALIDTVQAGFENELQGRINGITDVAALDYVIMNHAEPDHAGCIPYILERSKALLITSEKGAKYAQLYFKVPVERIKTVKEGESIELGGATLKFIEAPMLHWPETMFTYHVEEHVLFPCDFFGAHTAVGMYESDNEELHVHAMRYFGEIMMPFRAMGKKAMDKIKDLEIKIIAPSHGCIYREPEKILESYRSWTEGITRKKVIVLYATMWNSTKAMVDTIVDSLLSEGIEVVVYDLAVSDMGEIIKDLVNSRAVVLGTPTVLGAMHPLALSAAYVIKLFKPPVQYGVIVSSYGWGPAAVKQATEILSSTKIELVGSHEVNGPPAEADLQKVKEYAQLLAKKIRLM
ncbi:MAG: MBL fold hydrolase [Candidatus Fischerbacteria bacterium RBG_13_37_8]|uniref:MBL fold hydrolase n=1 Tax=Candidatus Fischerbacteria bacterium RBG_13_37_8 TaxID=1817863 RepID=A0A1F5VMJ3_9BACT|nr:MAG: MBL fold hydrolase [Candidatus Fischerbacteria bacterium RBG_13_37_8]